MSFKQVIDKNNVSEKTLENAVKSVVILLSPFVPHITEELWQKMGRSESM